MNALDGLSLDYGSFAFRDIQGQDSWSTFAPVFGSLTVVGAATYSGRYRFVGRQFFFQVKASAATSIASVAGTDYLTLPVVAVGIGGMAVMDNDTTNAAVGNCKIKVSSSGAAGRCYLPAQAASANTFIITGWCEV